MPTSEGPFDRDLSYLVRFLDKLAGHAGELGGEQGEALAALIAEEKERWGRITALLGGEPAAEAPAPDEPTEAHESTDVTIETAPSTDPGVGGDSLGTIAEMPAVGRSQAPLPPSARTGSAPPTRAPWTVGSLVDTPRKR